MHPLCVVSGRKPVSVTRRLQMAVDVGFAETTQGQLTASEKLLCKFGHAVKAYLAVDSSAKAAGGKPLLMLKPSRPSHRNVAPKLVPSEHPALSALETRTNALVSGVGGVDFQLPQFSLKDK